jgi:plastocyanin
MKHTTLRTIAIVAAAVATSYCGGSGGYSTSPSPASTNPTSPSTTSAVTVSIVATNGNKSYVPNPVQTGGQDVVFKNNDSLTHHIVMDDGSADFGNLAPGVSSAAKAVASGGNFHCTIHPSMVGSINGAVAPEPAPGSGNGY